MDEIFNLYGIALIAMFALIILGMVLSILSATQKAKAGLVSGAEPSADYTDPVYRWSRSYQNLTENIGFIVAAVIFAIMAGVSPWLVNLLGVVTFVTRVIYTYILVKGLGKSNQGARSFAFTGGWASCVILSVAGIFAVLF